MDDGELEAKVAELRKNHPSVSDTLLRGRALEILQADKTSRWSEPSAAVKNDEDSSDDGEPVGRS